MLPADHQISRSPHQRRTVDQPVIAGDPTLITTPLRHEDTPFQSLPRRPKSVEEALRPLVPPQVSGTLPNRTWSVRGTPRSRGTTNLLALTSFKHMKCYRNSIASVRSRGKTKRSQSQTHTLPACFLFILRTCPLGSGSHPQVLIFPHLISLKKSNPAC